MGRTLFKLGRKRWARQSPLERIAMLGFAVLATIALVAERVTNNNDLAAEPTTGIEQVINPQSMQPPVELATHDAATPESALTSSTDSIGSRVSATQVAPAPPATQKPTRAAVAARRSTITPTESVTMGTGEVLLGTRGLAAVLYINGTANGVINRLDAWQAPAGRVQLSIRADNCEPWDSTVVVDAGAQVRIGYRAPTCGDQ